MTSINTNASAAIALQTLRATTSEIDTLQNQITTGKKVNSAKDNASAWSIASRMESDVASTKAVQNGLNFGQAAVSVARQGAESTNDLLNEIKTRVVAAQGAGADRTQLAAEIADLAGQVTSVLDTAQFNGENLLKSTNTLSVASSITRDSAGAVTVSTIDVDGLDFTTALAGLASLDVSDATNAATSLDALETMIGTVTAGASALGSSENRMEKQNEFLSKINDSMEAGISALVDTDMEEAAARLSAAQVQQQLGAQMLASSNRQPQRLLQLFS